MSYIIFSHFFLYWETTKTVARDIAKTAACVFWITAKTAGCVFWITAKTAACVFWITAKTAACFQKGFITIITFNIVFIDFM